MSEVALHSPSRVSATAAPLLPLRVEGLKLVRGGAAILDGIDLHLTTGGCTVLMGPNGAGKSLLLKVLHGLLLPDAGSVSWNGTPARRATRRQALVFQTPVLLRRSVQANMDFVLKARNGDPARARQLLEHVGLSAQARQPARRLSGGERQRLALARALATDPEILLLDEPTASLDPASTLVIERIVGAARDQGVHVIFVTHDTGQARRMADEVVFLHRGRITEHTPAPQFFSAPASRPAQDFLAGRIVV